MILPLNKNNTHIIQKQAISIEFENPGSTLGLQDHIAELFYEKVQPRIAGLFDEMADEDHVIHIEKLEIDCGTINGKHWEYEWVDTVMFQLKKALNDFPKSRIAPQRYNSQFIFFLETGQLPWNCDIAATSRLEDLVVFDPAFFAGIQEILIDSAPARQRLIHQFSEKFQKRLMEAYLNWEGNYTVFENLKDKVHPFQTNNISDIVAGIMGGKKRDDLFVKNGAGQPGIKQNSERKNKAKHSAEIFIGNAGLVLLHPFLPAFFEELKLIKDKQWVSEASQQQAVLITAFLVTGQEDLPESGLSLNKIICGMELHNTIFHRLLNYTEIKTAGEELLTQVIQHWSVLKNTGIESLRETFLIRNGKLTQVDNGWQLQVEQKGVDVLINKLPWGIGVVRQPWMETVLFVDWA